jgi:hypothetical protein
MGYKTAGGLKPSPIMGLKPRPIILKKGTNRSHYSFIFGVI